MPCSVESNLTPTAVTHDATPVNAVEITTQNGNAYKFQVEAIAHSEDGDTALWNFFARVIRDAGGNITILAQPLDLALSKDLALAMASVELVVVSGALYVSVKGVSSKDVNFYVDVCGTGIPAP